MARREFNPDSPYGALEFALKRNPELIPQAGKILVLNPRAHSILQLFAPERTICVTPERRDVERLEQRGYRCVTALTPDAALPSEEFSLCIVFPGESRDETLYLLATGAAAVSPGGTLLASMPNDLGASRFEGKLEALMGSVESRSKNHCRVFWATVPQSPSPIMAEWRALGELKEIPGSTLKSVPGLFSWSKIDQGSKLLAANLPTLSGKVADLGCGYGYLAAELLARSPQVTELALFDSDYRAIETSRLNLSGLAKATTRISFHWEDIQSKSLHRSFDFVVMNPPFHEYGTLRVELGKRFFSTASELLMPGGTLFAVVNRHLPYDETLWGLFPEIHDIVVAEGYRVLRARAK